MKNKILKIVSFALMCAMMSSVLVRAESTAYSWSTPRNGNKQPIFPREAELITEHGGYYIDKRHTDDTDEKVLYLTFDAGYENGNIERILNVMKQKDVRGAFFVLDHLIIDNTELVKRMKSEGHMVCNHTKSHKDLTKCTDGQIAEDLAALEKICEEKAGFSLDKYFRFPEGKYSISALKCVNALGYKTVFWSFGYADWDNNKQPGTEYAMRKILDNTHNGEVILLHPTSATNAEILPSLIDAWRAMGFRFGTLDELTTDRK